MRVTLYFIAIVFAFIVGFGIGAYADTKPHCKPALYDAIYLRLQKESLKYNIEKLDLINREGFVYTDVIDREPNLFKIFRQLCYGQKTSFERKGK